MSVVTRTAQVDLTPPDANPYIKCMIEEYWNLIASGAAACGGSYTYNTMKQVGISKTELDTLSSKISSSLTSGIAGLSGEISSSCSVTINFNEMQQQQHSYLQPSGLCDRIEINISQKIRRITFDIKETSWPSLFNSPKQRQIHVFEHTDQFDFDCPKIPHHPACRCEAPPPTILGRIVAKFGRKSCWMEMTLVDMDSALTIPELGVLMPERLPSGRLYKTTVAKQSVPPPVLFLSGERGDGIEFLFTVQDSSDQAVDWSGDATAVDLVPAPQSAGLSTLDVTGLDPGTVELLSVELEKAALNKDQVTIRDLGHSIEIGSFVIDRRHD